MSKKLLTGGVVFVIALGVLIWIARPSDTVSVSGNGDTTATATPGALVTDEPQVALGSVSMAAGDVTRTFTVRNTSNAAVTLRQMYTSCMCTTASVEFSNGVRRGPYGMPGHGINPSFEERIEPNETFTVAVVFDPAAHGPAGIGPVERTVTLEYDEGKMLTFGFSATVTP